MGSRLVIAVTALLLCLCAPAAAATYTKGVDVSHWQGAISWPQVVSADISFAFMKATEGTTIADLTYPVNRSGAASVGIRSGAYHFARPSGSGEPAIVADAIAEADYFLSVAQPQPGDLPPVLDLETRGGLDSTSLLTWASAWLEEVYERTGVRALVYTSPNFWKQSLADTGTVALNGYPLWVAHWTSGAAPLVPAANWGNNGWTFWQWSSTWRVAGIPTAVDGDRFRGPSLAAVAIPRYPTAAPAASEPPTVLGTAQTGKRLTAVPGSWIGGKPLTFTYQWQRCDAAGQSCTPIAGALAPTYAPAADDVGHALTVLVTAQAPAGVASAVSPATTAVTTLGGAAARPAVTQLPVVGGTTVVGQVLSASVGAWTGAPSAFAYQWQRCTTQCAAIVGATAATYTLTPDDIGATVGVVVTATGRGGSTSATATPSPAVAAAPVPPPVAGSLIALAGGAGAVATLDGTAVVTWQPGAVRPNSTVTLERAGTSVVFGVTPPVARLPWPVDVSLGAPTGDTVVGVSTDGPSSNGIVWRAAPDLPSPALTPAQPFGAYVDSATGSLHVLLRMPARIRQFDRGAWGDPRLVAAGPPRPRLVGRVQARRSRGAVVVTARIVVPSQARLVESIVGKTSAKRAQLLAPGSTPVRIAVSGRKLVRGSSAALRVAARDPYGRTAVTVLRFRVP